MAKVNDKSFGFWSGFESNDNMELTQCIFPLTWGRLRQGDDELAGGSRGVAPSTKPECVQWWKLIHQFRLSIVPCYPLSHMVGFWSDFIC